MNDYSNIFLLSDMDGTLINSSAQISAVNKYALEQFTAEGWIEATGALRGRRRYRITEEGIAMLAREYQRLQQQVRDYECYAGKEAQP